VNVFFVGGVHGAGKSTLCQQLSGPLEARHVTASELIRYVPEPDDPTRRAVADVKGNQGRLIAALEALRQNDIDLILDGHFCVLDQDGRIVPIPLETFKEIDPVALLLVEARPVEIRARLAKRGAKPYEVDLITELLTEERYHAQRTSSTLNIPLKIWDATRGITDALQFLAASRQR
jgi:adenylate kinase